MSLAAANLVYAAGGTVVTLPQPGMKIKSGLSMTVDLRGIDANGYRPVAITVRPLNGLPLPGDRVLRVVLTPYAYMSNLAPEASQVIELAEGSTATTVVLPIPQTSQWHSCSIDTFEDGEKLRDLSIERIGFAGISYWDWTEARPGTLIVDRAVPDRATRDRMVVDYRTRGTDLNPAYTLPEPRVLANLFPEANRPNTFFPGGQRPSDAALLENLSTNYPRLDMVPPGEIPERWIELSQFDLIIIPLADLRALAASEPKRVRALAEWAAGGPLLVVSGVGSDFAGLAEIEQLLALPPLEAASGGEIPRGWTPPPAAAHTAILQSQIEDFEETSQLQLQPMRGGYRYVNPVPPQGNAAYRRGQKPDTLAAPAQPPFAVRPIGLGVVAGMATDNPFPGQDSDWIWLFNSIPRRHWTWYQRNGFSLHRENGDYWRFLIPGVGEAPALSFLILVSLFAVVIGPVNYLLLGKTGRYYLLLITVPLGALLVTGGLFSYALMTDGLGVRLRARSFTDLDQSCGRAVAWSRQSYYASIAPSRGLVFPADATVFPILYQPGQRFNSGNRPDNSLHWDEQQNLTRGYITSRTTTQFMVLRATQSQDRLSVTEGRSPGSPPHVANQLKTRIRLVILRDRRGDFWKGENLADGQGAALAAVTAADAAALLKQLIGADPPELPEGYDPSLHNTAFSMFMPSYGWYNVDASATQPLMATSILESNLAYATRPGDMARGSYLAIVTSSPTAPTGVPRVREEASLHVIRGRY